MFGIPYVVTVHGGDIDKMAAKSQRIADMTKKFYNKRKQSSLLVTNFGKM